MIRTLFGGSFDPLHNGHLAMIDLLRRRGLADVVHVCPAWLSPHKTRTVATADDRLRLVHLGVAGLDGVEVVDLEVRRGGVSYTIETLTELKAEYPADEWCFVVGADNLAAFDTWHRPRRLLDLARPLVFARGDSAAILPPEFAGRARLVEDFDIPVSATEIRRRLAAGEEPHRDLPPAVLEAIISAGLYGTAERD